MLLQQPALVDTIYVCGLRAGHNRRAFTCYMCCCGAFALNTKVAAAAVEINTHRVHSVLPGGSVYIVHC
jgi:hypothetical protein